MSGESIVEHGSFWRNLVVRKNSEAGNAEHAQGPCASSPERRLGLDRVKVATYTFVVHGGTADKSKNH